MPRTRTSSLNERLEGVVGPRVAFIGCQSVHGVHATLLKGQGTHGRHSSSFLGLPYEILNTNPKKELLWSLWVRQKPKNDVHIQRGRLLSIRVHLIVIEAVN